MFDFFISKLSVLVHSGVILYLQLLLELIQFGL